MPHALDPRDVTVNYEAVRPARQMLAIRPAFQFERFAKANIDGPLVAVVGLYPTSVSAASYRRCPSRKHNILVVSFYWRWTVASPNKTTNEPVDLPPPGPKKRNPQELDKMLDEALEDSMIASDPPAVTQPDVKIRAPKAKRQKRN
jgi:hypothetical protein